MKNNRLDFKNMGVGKLFARQLFPALLGMVASALYVVVDGIFVGRGVGSDAIAAVNINNPIMTLVSGIGLMFGMGGGVLASLALSRGKRSVANRILMQTVSVSVLFSCILTLILCLFPYEAGIMLGSDEYLLDMVVEFLFWYALCFPFMVLMNALPFFIRLSNPNIPMWALAIGAILNVVLDYIFVFPLGWGLFGAAIATGIGQTVAALIMIVYLFRKDITVRFIRMRFKFRAVLTALRDIWYMTCLGFPVFLSEVTVSIMGISGNYAFMEYLGPNGVAAFSIVCYLFPVVFMVFNATIQSAQPIISYNYGCGLLHRSKQALRYAIYFATGFALTMTILFIFKSGIVVDLFIPDTSNPAWEYASYGLPYFAVDFVFFGINTIVIGYFMSIENLRMAIVLTVTRGILPVLCFWLLPQLMGNKGLWLSVAAADILTTAVIVVIYCINRSGCKSKLAVTA